MAAIVNYRDLLLQATSPRVVPLPIDPNLIPGLPGAIAATKGVRISGPSNIFKVAQDGSVSPGSIALTATITNVTGEVSWSVVAGSATLTSYSGLSTTLLSVAMASASVTIRATIVFEGGTYTSDYTVAKVQDGTNGTNGSNGTNGTNGLPGSNTALVYAYQRSATPLTSSPGDVTWTFNAAQITSPVNLLNGWQKSIPAGTLPLYVTIATATSTTNTDSIAAAEWTAPTVLVRDGADGSPGANGSNGTNGVNTATLFLFTRSNSTSAPTRPQATLTYTFGSSFLTGDLGIWTQTVPLMEGKYLWVTTATAAGSSATYAIPPSAWAEPRIMAEDGSNGLEGLRGSLSLSATMSSVQRYTSRPLGLANWSAGAPSTENAEIADRAARTVVWTALGNSGSPENNAHLRIGDTVTLTNGQSTVAVTGYWGGASWLFPGTTIDGNLLVKGSVSADSINSYGLSIYTPDGQIVIDANRRLSRNDLTDLGVLAALNSLAYGSANLTGFGGLAGQNSVGLASAQVTGNLPNSRVDGLGALALQNQVNLTNQVTGALANSNVSGLGALALLNQVNLNVNTIGTLNGLTQVTNLGALAYAEAIAANQIGAGTLAAGVIYAGTVNVDKLTGTLISGKNLSGTDFIYIAGANSSAPLVIQNMGNGEVRFNMRGYFEVSRSDSLSSFVISSVGNLTHGSISTGVSAQFLGSSFTIQNQSINYPTFQTSAAAGVILRHDSIRLLASGGSELLTTDTARVNIKANYLNLRQHGGNPGGAVHGDMAVFGNEVVVFISGAWYKLGKTAI